MDIGNLSLSPRIYLALKKNEIYTLNDLLSCSKAKLLAFKSIDKKSFKTIETALFEIGIVLKKKAIKNAPLSN